MTIAECEECGKVVSTKAYACPHCGAPGEAIAYECENCGATDKRPCQRQPHRRLFILEFFGINFVSLFWGSLIFGAIWLVARLMGQ